MHWQCRSPSGTLHCSNAVIIPQNWGAIPSSVLCTLEDIVPQLLRMMTALTDTSSPELPYSLNFFFGLLVQMMTPKGHFEINWSLASEALFDEGSSRRSQDVFLAFFSYLLTWVSLYFGATYRSYKSVEWYKILWIFRIQCISVKLWRKSAVECTHPSPSLQKVTTWL